MWALSPPEENSIASLSPINFAYPLGDNTQTLLNTDEDAVARVGIAMATRLFQDHKVFHVFSEEELKEAHKQVAGQEVQTIRNSIQAHIVDPVVRDDLTAFFDSQKFDDVGVVSGGQQSQQVMLDDEENAGGAIRREPQALDDVARADLGAPDVTRRVPLRFADAEKVTRGRSVGQISVCSTVRKTSHGYRGDHHNGT